MVTLFQLNSFCTVADEGSFSIAAEKMYISQPSVSQHIASLEEHFGVRLFNRRKRRIRLTPEGRLLYTAAKEILGRLAEVSKRMEGLKSLETGTLSVGYTAGMDAGPLPGMMAEYAVAFPGVNLSLTCGHFPHLLDALKNGDIELALAERNLEASVDAGISSQVVGTDRLVLVAAPEMILPGEPLSPKDLERLPFITWSAGSPFSAYLDDFSLRYQIRLDSRSAASTPSALAELAVKGIGMGLVPESAVAPYIDAGRLRVIPVEDARPVTVDFLALFHQTQGLTYAGWEMLRFLENKLKTA